jgi:hypothetical protein
VGDEEAIRPRAHQSSSWYVVGVGVRLDLDAQDGDGAVDENVVVIMKILMMTMKGVVLAVAESRLAAVVKTTSEIASD